MMLKFRRRAHREEIPIPPFVAEGVVAVPLAKDALPERIVLVRLHALGDAAITLPVIAGLRRALPASFIAVVTSREYMGLFEQLDGINDLFGIVSDGTKFQRFKSVLDVAAMLPNIDLLLDLQRSRLSRLLGCLLRPKAAASFDRFAPRSALDRYLDAVHRVGLRQVRPRYHIDLNVSREPATLPMNLRTGPEPLICLNPAGCWPTKNWPVEKYIALARKMVDAWNARIVLLGTGNVETGAAAIASALGAAVVDLVGRTTISEAVAVVGRLDLMVSDDSGLMHMAWTQGVPTIAIFGASRSTWSRPCGEHTRTYGSEDLECGACMRPECVRGDLHCLRRLSVEEVFHACGELMARRCRF